MQSRLGWIAALVAAAVAAFILVPMFVSSPAHPAGPTGIVGQPAPIFDLRDTNGNAVSLRGERGRVVVMNLWASWCPPCRAEMPDLQRLAVAYAARGVVVIGANQGESARHAAAFARSLDVRFPIWLDSEQRYGRAYRALGLPTTVFIGRNGTIERAFDGPLTYPQMRAVLDGVLR